MRRILTIVLLASLLAAPAAMAQTRDIGSKGDLLDRIAKPRRQRHQPPLDLLRIGHGKFEFDFVH